MCVFVIAEFWLLRFAFSTDHVTKTNAGPDFLLELQQRCRAAYVTRRRWIVRERLRQRRRQPQLRRGKVATPLLLVQPLGLRGGGAEQRVGQAGERAHAQSEGAGPSAGREAERHVGVEVLELLSALRYLEQRVVPAARAGGEEGGRATLEWLERARTPWTRGARRGRPCRAAR